jgi:hypothetical protein
VCPSEPYSSVFTLCTGFLSASALLANSFAARMGPTVWELEGPIPMVKSSNTETANGHLARMTDVS